MLLPDPLRRGEIKFLFARSLSYTTRLALIVVLMSLGFALQLVLSLWFDLLSVCVGVPFLLAGTILSLVEGYSNIPKYMPGKREWRGATRENLENIVRLNRKSKQWDQSLIDITCSQGVVMLVIVGAMIAGVACLLSWTEQDWLLKVWVADTVVLVVPHWFSGIRRVLTNDPLVIKTEMLLSILDVWEGTSKDDEVMVPQMEVRRGRIGEIPADAKLVLRFNHADETFLGLQNQVTLNNVQGKDYPYFYCVLVARPEFDLLNRVDLQAPAKMTVEPKRDGEVDIIVIRQRTTKRSGYHTNRAAAARIFVYALTVTRELLAYTKSG